jgi:hypothetical protein
MSFCSLGDYQFRIEPSNVVFPFEVDYTVIPTVGGRVVQVYGVTVGDMIVQGLFGQERTGQNRESWELAEEFQTAMGKIVKAQSAMPSMGQLAGYDPKTMHPPVRFLFNDDTPERRASGQPIHTWDFQVYVKNLQDSVNPEYAVEHSTGKFSYGYTLTLFIVEDNSRVLRQVAADKFIERLATGVGWKRTVYNGPMDMEELTKYVKENSPDGTIHGLVLDRAQKAANGELLPGGAATAGDAKTALDKDGKPLPGAPAAPGAKPGAPGPTPPPGGAGLGSGAGSAGGK